LTYGAELVLTVRLWDCKQVAFCELRIKEIYKQQVETQTKTK